MKYFFSLFIFGIPLLACFGQELSTATADKLIAEVWEVVEKRNTTWLENDEPGHFAIYHRDFRRWSVHKPSLLTKDIFKGFWDAIKSNEKVISLKVIPEEVQIFHNGTMAIAHYTIDEKYEWIGPDKTNGDGEVIKTGTQLNGNLRFSDIYIKENGSWLYVGGHRDGSYLK